MKKMLSIILPSIIIIAIALIGMYSKSILIGLYLLFPIIFIMQGAMYSSFNKELIIGFILSSIAFIAPINLLYKMGSCIEILVVYNILGFISYVIKSKVVYKINS